MATEQVAAQSVSSGLPPGLRLGTASLPQGSNEAGRATLLDEASDPASTPNGLVANGKTSGLGQAVSGNEKELDGTGAFLHLSAACARMPVGLVVSVPVRDFRVRTLLAMVAGTVIETQWGVGEDLPLSSGDVQLAWSEFEVVDTRLAVRVTRLA